MCISYTNITVSRIGPTGRREHFHARALDGCKNCILSPEAGTVQPDRGTGNRGGFLRRRRSFFTPKRKRAVLARFGVGLGNSSTLGQKSRKTPKNGQNGRNTGTAENRQYRNPNTRARLGPPHLPQNPGGPQQAGTLRNRGGQHLNGIRNAPNA